MILSCYMIGRSPPRGARTWIILMKEVQRPDPVREGIAGLQQTALSPRPYESGNQASMTARISLPLSSLPVLTVRITSL